MASQAYFVHYAQMRLRAAAIQLVLAAMGSDVASASVPTRPATAAVAESGHMVHQAPGARALPGRDGRRRSLAYFAHLTDTQIADEASPARHEWLYGLKPMFEGFWRPQEAFILHVIDQVVRAVNRRRISPLPSAGCAFQR